MNFNSSEARRILRLEANVRDLQEKLDGLKKEETRPVFVNEPISSGNNPQKKRKKKNAFNVKKKLIFQRISPVEASVLRAKKLIAYRNEKNK